MKNITSIDNNFQNNDALHISENKMSEKSFISGAKNNVEKPMAAPLEDKIEVRKEISLNTTAVSEITRDNAQVKANYVKDKIIEQTSNAILTQANLAPQIVLTIMQQ